MQQHKDDHCVRPETNNREEVGGSREKAENAGKIQVVGGDAGNDDVTDDEDK